VGRKSTGDPSPSRIAVGREPHHRARVHRPRWLGDRTQWVDRARVLGLAADAYYRLASALEHSSGYPEAIDAYSAASDFCHRQGISGLAEVCFACRNAARRGRNESCDLGRSRGAAPRTDAYRSEPTVAPRYLAVPFRARGAAVVLRPGLLVLATR
jgi:hypothetical protein